MASETMTSKERLWAAIALEKPDRVPVAPLMSSAAPAPLLGLDPKDVYTSGVTQLDAELQVFDTYGGWDGVIPTPITPNIMSLSFKLKVPGQDESVKEMQTIEVETLKPEDYE